MGRLNVQAQLQRDKVTPKGTAVDGDGDTHRAADPAGRAGVEDLLGQAQARGGKLAADSPLKPKARRLGKAQFNWYPTRDLQFSWPTALFSWGAIVVTLLAVGATFLFKDAYSPGPLSTSHFRSDLSINPAIAKIANNSTCTTCHAAQASMNQNCASCHTTSAFSSDVSDIHMKVGMTCVSCHSEHNGRNFSPGWSRTWPAPAATGTAANLGRRLRGSCSKLRTAM